MAIALAIIFALVFMVSYILMPKGILRIFSYLISLAILIGSLWVINAGDNNHFGMKKVTVSEDKILNPVTDIKQLDTKLLIKKPLGTKDESVIVYKDAKNKQVHTQIDKDTENKFTRNNKETPKLNVSTTKYVYKNNFFKILYAGLDNNNVYVSRVNNFIINDDYIVITPEQAKKMQKDMKAQQAKAKPLIKKMIQQKVMQARMANPAMTPAQQKQLVEQITKGAQAQAMKKGKENLRNMSIE